MYTWVTGLELWLVFFVDDLPVAVPRLRPTKRRFGVFFGLSVDSCEAIEMFSFLEFESFSFIFKKVVRKIRQKKANLLSLFHSSHYKFIDINWSTYSIGETFVESKQNRMFRSFSIYFHLLKMFIKLKITIVSIQTWINFWFFYNTTKEISNNNFFLFLLQRKQHSTNIK